MSDFPDKLKPQLAAMMKYCAYSERCIADVQQKLQQKGVEDQEERSIIIQKLIEEQFIDEARYAKAMANDRFKFRHWGRRKIAHKLREKQIDHSLIDEALEQIDKEAYSASVESLITKHRKADQLGKNKLIEEQIIKFLINKGFEPDLCREIIRKLSKK